MFTPFVLLASCVVLSGAQYWLADDRKYSVPECNEPNEVLSHCVQPCGGEDSCYDRNQISCPHVIQSCVPACVCKEGYIRKTVSSECIPKEECGGPCEIFTHYSECQKNSKETCSSIGNPSKSDDSTEACTPGCACWDGYYRANETEPCLHRCFCPELENSPKCESWRG